MNKYLFFCLFIFLYPCVSLYHKIYPNVKYLYLFPAPALAVSHSAISWTTNVFFRAAKQAVDCSSGDKLGSRARILHAHCPSDDPVDYLYISEEENLRRMF